MSEMKILDAKRKEGKTIKKNQDAPCKLYAQLQYTLPGTALQTPSW